jgi:TP901 family phage tail tape measure protein
MATEKIIIKIETGSASKQVGKLNNELGKTNKSAKKTGKGMSGIFGAIKQGVTSAIPALNSLKIAMISTGVGALVVGVGALVGVFAKAAQKGAEFSKGVSTLRAVTGKTAEELEAVTEQAQNLGATTAFTAKQVLDLQTELAKLGFTIDDIQNSTPAILDLAASLEVDLASAAAFAGSTVKGFGLTTEETQRVVDVMALSTSRSALDFEKLRESMKMVAPVASAAGVSVEKTTALLGALADRGISGSMAGTGLSKTFIELSKKGMTLEEAMDKVNNSSNGLNTAIELVGINGAKSLLNLASTGKDQLNDLESQFLNAEGSAQKMAEVRLDNLEGDMTKLGSAWEGFLLGLEDGEGPINDLQRTLVQGLTYAITGLGTVVDWIAFAFKENWNAIKLTTGGSVDIIVGYFTILGNGIKLFANKAMLALADVPIIGKAINKAEVEANINEAKDALVKGTERIQAGVEKFKQAAIQRLTTIARFRAQQEGKAERVQQAKENKRLQEQKKQQEAESEEDRKKRLEERKKELEKLAKIEEKYAKQSEDLQDTTDLAKAQRKRERALAEIEALKLTETEKREAIKQVNDYYDQVEAEAKLADDEKEAEEKLKKQEEKIAELELTKEQEALDFEEQRALIEERRALLLEDETLSGEQKQALLKKFNEAEAKLDKQKVASKQEALQAIANIAGAETKVGQALLIAKNMLAFKETLMDLKRITFKGKKAVTEAGVNAASNVSESSKIGFPQNIITIAGAIGQGISIIRQVKKAVSKTGASGGSASVPSVPSAARASASGSQSTQAQTQTQAPAFNVIGASPESQLATALAGQSQQPVQAYVVSNDVTTSQSLDRNIVEGATL